MNKIISTILAALLSFSFLGAAAKSDETVMKNVGYGSVDVDEKEIVLEFELDYKDEFANTISAKDFELDYGFNAMTIGSIEWEDDMSFNITLDGKLDRAYETAQVRILSSAFTDGRPYVDVTFDIVKPQMFIDYGNISFEGGILSLPISLYQCKFEKDADVSGISLTGDLPVTVKGFKRVSEKTAVVALAAEGFNNIDEVLKAIDTAALDGAALSLSGDILTTINGTAMNLDMPFEEAIPIIEETVINEDGTIQVLCRLYGYSGKIDNSLITLGGDFGEGFALYKDNETFLSFKVNPGKELITGTITLAPGALTNPWGTPSSTLVYTRSISSDDVSQKATAMGFVPFEEIGEYSYMPYQDISEMEVSQTSVLGVLGVIGTVGSVFGAVNSAKTFGETIAGLFGFSAGPDPLAPVMEELNAIRQDIAGLNSMIAGLTVDVAVEGAKTRINSFNEKIVSMNEYVKTFYVETEIEIKTILRMSDAEGVTPPSALAGEYYDSLTPEQKQQAIKDFERASVSFKADPGMSKATILANLGGEDSDAATIVFTKAAQKIGLKKYEGSPFSGVFVDDYKSLCNFVSGGTSQSILTDYDVVINGTYNWETEAYEKRAGYRVMVLSTLIDAGKALDVCLSAYSIDYPKTDVQNAYNSAVRYATSGAGSTKDRNEGNFSNRELCLTVNKTVQYYKPLDYGSPLLSPLLNNRKETNVISEGELKLIKLRANRLGRSIRTDMTNSGFSLLPNKDSNGAYIVAGIPVENGKARDYKYDTSAVRYGAPGYYLDDRKSLEPVSWLIVCLRSKGRIISPYDSYSFLAYD
ncbi:MAG: hypothetical protein LBL98_01520 [Ruminococcus sp.]|jgi:hypothetical protein|nr:hypothetical protein [Ruminococcus sp.]